MKRNKNKGRLAALALALALVFALSACGGRGAPSVGTVVLIPAPTPTPDPASLLVGTWTGSNGVGLKFSSDGTVKLSGFGLSLGGDTFTYEVTGENELTLTATVGGILSADMKVPYTLSGDTLNIEIQGGVYKLTKQ